MKTASFVAILLAIKVFMADLCIWQASGLAGIHNASLYISLRNGERNHFEENTKIPALVRSREAGSSWEFENQSRLLKFTRFSLFLSHTHIYILSFPLLTSTPCFLD